MLRFVQSSGSDAACDISRIAEENKISDLLAFLLVGRGIVSRTQVQAFLHPSLAQLHDPLLLPDMRKAADRINHAITMGERICVYGDYDADGVCATAILLQYLYTRNADAVPFLPSRHREGYGMHEDAVRRLAQQGIRLIITVDNGIAASKEIALCRTLGMDVIVTDHHQCPQTLPDCTAVVNPHRPDSQYPYPCLWGAGIALKLVQALGANDAIYPYLPLAALATVADVVELKDENRAIVAAGLPLVPEHIGFNALLAVSGSAGQNVNSETLAFRLAPRLNAAGRMGDPMRSLMLLTAADMAQAKSLALILNDENERRQTEEQRILRDAHRQLTGKDTARMRAILLYSPDWNPGVIGIVASKLAEEYYRPVMLFHLQDNLLTGSCRSIPGIHLFECLQAFEARLIRFGGHAQAAGLTMELGQFEAFSKEFDCYLREHIHPHTFVPTLPYEREVPLKELSLQAVEELSVLAPYGEGNPQPVFRARGVRLEDTVCMGKGDAHLRSTAVQGNRRVSLVAFGYGNRAREWSQGGIFDLLYTSDVNAWKGSRRLQLMLHAAKRTTFFDDPNEILNRRSKFVDAFFRNVLYNVSRSAVWTVVADMDEAIVHALQEDMHGTLILCATAQGADRLRALLLQQHLEDAVDVYWQELPVKAGSVNAILLAPHFSALPHGCYARLYLYDGCLTVYTQNIDADAGAVFLPVENDTAQMLAPLRVSRKEMGHIYRRFLAQLKNGPVARNLLFQAGTVEDRERAVLALLVFIELGFFQWDPATDLASVVSGFAPRSLFDSKLYSEANEGNDETFASC